MNEESQLKYILAAIFFIGNFDESKQIKFQEILRNYKERIFSAIFLSMCTGSCMFAFWMVLRNFFADRIRPKVYDVILKIILIAYYVPAGWSNCNSSEVWRTNFPNQKGKRKMFLPVEEEQLKTCIYHELTHYKKYDIFWNYIACLMVCIHWYCPWISKALFYNDF